MATPDGDGAKADSKRLPDEPPVPREAVLLTGLGPRPFAGLLLDNWIGTGDSWGSMVGGATALLGLLWVTSVRLRKWRFDHRRDLFEAKVTGPDKAGFFHVNVNLKHVPEDDIWVYVNRISGVEDTAQNPFEPTWNLPWRKDAGNPRSEYRRLWRNTPDDANLAGTETQVSGTLNAFSTSGGTLVMHFSSAERQAVFSLVIHGRRVGAIYMNVALGYDGDDNGIVIDQRITARQSPAELEIHGLKDEVLD